MSYAATVLALNPTGYWRLGDSPWGAWADLSGHGYHAVAAGAATNWTAGAPGLLLGDPDAALSNNTQAVAGGPTVAHASWMDVTTLSVSAIMRCSTPPASDFGCLVSNRADAAHDNAWAFYLQPSGAMWVRLVHNTGGEWLSSLRNVCDGLPHHFVLTVTGTTALLYIDGVLDTSLTMSAGLATASYGAPLTFGHEWAVGATSAPRGVHGTVDEVAFWSGTVLTAANVLGLYAASFLPLVAPTRYADVVIADAPEVYFRLGEASGATMVDSSGHGRNGTYSNGPTLGVNGALPVDADMAATFNGTNQYGSCSAYTGVTGSGARTVECWLKTSTTTAVSPEMFGYGGSGAFQWWDTFLDDGNGYRLRNGNGGGGQVWGSPLNDGQWHHIVVVYPGGGAAQSATAAYIDGVLAPLYFTGGTVSSAPSTTATSLTVGAENSSGGFFPGSLDEVAFYSYALTPDQVRAHYQAGIGHAGRDYVNAVLADSPVSLWPLNDATTAAAACLGSHRVAGTYKSATPQSLQIARDSVMAPSFPGGLANSVDSSSPSWVKINADSAYSPQAGGSGKLTVEVILQASTLATGPYMVAGKGTSPSAYEWDLRVAADGTISLNIFTGAGANVMVIASVAGAIQVGQTYHVAATFDAAAALGVVYINGQEVGRSTSISGTSSATSSIAYIGHRQDGGGYDWAGYLSCVAIYSVALTAAQVATHAALALPQASPEGAGAYVSQVVALSPLAYWPLHSNGVLDLSDWSGNGRALTLHQGSTAGPIVTEAASPQLPRMSRSSAKWPSSQVLGFATVAEYSYLSYTPPSWVAPFSVGFWFRPRSSKACNILGSRWYNANFGLGVGMQADGSMYCDLGNGTTWLANGPSGTPGMVLPYRWNHAVLSVSTTGFNWYVNGQPAGSSTVSLTGAILGNASHTITLGWHGWPVDLGWTGGLSDVALYGAALTQAQAAALYYEGLRGGVRLGMGGYGG